MKKVTIASMHSNFLNTAEYSAVKIPLIGGCPYFCYIWIDDTCFTLVKTARGYKIHKTKKP